MELVVVEGAEIDGIAFAAALRQPVDIDEEVEALLGLVGQQLDMAEMRDVERGFASRHFHPFPAFPFGAAGYRDRAAGFPRRFRRRNAAATTRAKHGAWRAIC